MAHVGSVYFRRFQQLLTFGQDDDVLVGRLHSDLFALLHFTNYGELLNEEVGEKQLLLSFNPGGKSWVQSGQSPGAHDTAIHLRDMCLHHCRCPLGPLQEKIPGNHVCLHLGPCVSQLPLRLKLISSGIIILWITVHYKHLSGVSYFAIFLAAAGYAAQAPIVSSFPESFFSF